jgi:4-hydroxyphenylpyruvate dioxygenase
VNQLDFAEVGQSGARLNEGGQQRSVVFEAAACRVVCSTPIGEGGRASRYLAKHPDGVGSIIFRVQDIERTFRLLETRGGTPVHDIETDLIDSEQFRTFVVTTPFGDTTFRFVERTHGYRLYPGMTLLASSQSSHNAMGLTHFDHITSNFETMSPALLWLEHVLGFERFWDVQFHTDDVRQREGAVGSGLRSAVMWDPASGVKFANNEPYRPHFRESQINVFHEQHRGDGIQHLAIAVSDIVSAVRRLRARGVEFMSTPSTYYDSLSERLLALGIGSIDEDPAELAELQILLDGDRENSYLLQIFLKDSAEFHKSADAGPFFYELIQRKGDQGFGAGNFRALFESIERDQRKAGG